MAAAWLRRTAELGHQHRLTFYDAVRAAAAEALGISLLSVDTRLLAAGLAESPAVVVPTPRTMKSSG